MKCAHQSFNTGRHYFWCIEINWGTINWYTIGVTTYHPNDANTRRFSLEKKMILFTYVLNEPSQSCQGFFKNAQTFVTKETTWKLKIFVWVFTTSLFICAFPREKANSHLVMIYAVWEMTTFVSLSCLHEQTDNVKRLSQARNTIKVVSIWIH